MSTESLDDAAPPESASAARRILNFLVKLGVSIGILGWVLHRTDTTRLAAALSSVTVPVVLLAVLVLAIQTVVVAYRWLLVARALGLRVPMLVGLQVLLVSLLLNQCFPSFVGGDAYRIYWLKRDGARLAHAFRSVMIDRISALVALVIMLAVTLPWLVARFHEARFDEAVWLLIAAGLAGTAVFLAGDRLFHGWRHNRFVEQFARLSSDARRLLLRDRRTLFVAPLAFVVQLSTSLTLFVFARGMAIPLGFVDCVLITPPLMLLTALPISVAGWGVREGVMVGLLALRGIESYSALALSFMLGVCGLLTATLGFIPLFIDWERYSPLRLRR